MNIAIKLGSLEELELLSYYKGPFKYYELPAKMLTEEALIRELVEKGFKFNIHSITMHTEKSLMLAIESSCHYLELCRQNNCLNYILHGLVVKEIGQLDNTKIISDITKTLDEINRYALKLGIRCFLENGCFINSDMAQFAEIPSRSATHIRMADELNIGMVLDLGHASLSSKWYGQTLEEFLSEYIKTSKTPDIIHFSDNFKESDSHLAVGEGSADLRSYCRAIEMWPDAIMTVENFPENIYKTLNWLIERGDSVYRKSDVEDFCSVMGWDFEKETINESR